MVKVMSHWCQLLEGLAGQSSEFYASVTKENEKRRFVSPAIFADIALTILDRP
jgi:hypothetical protein